MDFTHKQTDAIKHQTCCKPGFEIAGQPSLQLNKGHRVFVNWLPGQMKGSAGTANAPLSKWLSKTVGTFRIILITPNAVKRRSEPDIQYSFCGKSAKYRMNEDGTVKNAVFASGEFPVQPIVRHIGSSGRTKYVNPMVWVWTRWGQCRAAKPYHLTFYCALLERHRTDRSQGNNRPNVKGLQITKKRPMRFCSPSECGRNKYGKEVNSIF